MSKILSKVISLVLCLAMVLVAFPAVADIKADAANITYSGSSSYMGGKYYTALTQVPKTGNHRTDIVNIAKSQVGYQESSSSSSLSGTSYGSSNCTEYGRWYGLQDMWCAMFVSWCAYVAGVSTSVVPSHAFTPTGLQWFIDRGQAYTRAKVAAGNYRPQPGDIIYFKSPRNSNITNHVGIVTSYSGTTVYTVEGNTSSATVSTDGGAVAAKSYDISNTYIVYICRPAYTTGDADSSGVYKVSANGDTLNLRDSASSSGNILVAIPDGTKLTVTDFSGNWAKTSYNGMTGWVSASYLVYVSAIVDEEAPKVSSVKVSDIDGTGYTVTCTVSDNTKVTAVKFPTWTEAGGQDDIKWLVGSISGSTASVRVKTTDFANASGKYVTHVYAYDAAENASAAAQTSAVVPAVAYPASYIPVYELNASTATENATLLTTGTFTAVYWGAAALSELSDGTYKVTSVYKSGAQKSLTASASNPVIAIHDTVDGYNALVALSVGDILKPNGINVKYGTLADSAYFAVPNNFALVSGSAGSLNDKNYFPSVSNTTVATVKAQFQCEVSILNASGTALASTSLVGTGCSIVKYNTDGSVLNKVVVILNGDISGDGVINSTDIASQKSHVKSASKLSGCYLSAADINGDGKVSTIDYIKLKIRVK